MFLYSFEVAAMTGEGVVAVHSVFQHSGDDVVGSITVGEAVGHDEVEHVARVESFYLCGIRSPLFEFVGDDCLLLVLFQADVECLRGCFRGVQIEDEVVGIVLLHNFLQDDVIRRDADIGRAYLFSVQHLQFGVVHTCPPKGRGYFLYHACGIQ